MPNTALQEAIKEAYASAPTNVVILETIELRHPQFSTPVRLVSDLRTWALTLEPDAPADPGEEVEFVPFAFRLEVPPVEDGSQPTAVITIDNVPREIVLEIEAAVTSAEPINFTYRPYLSTDTSGPQMDPPLHLVISDITAGQFQIVAKATYGDFANRQFPNVEYDLTNFPGLVTAA